MNEYKIKWISMVYNCFFSGIILWIMFKIIVLALGFMSRAEGQDKLLWIIIIGIMCIAIKIRLPYFDTFVICEKCGQGVHQR